MMMIIQMDSNYTMKSMESLKKHKGLYHGKIRADHIADFESIKLKFRSMDPTKFQVISQN